jgi:hypothetical protein
VVAALHKVLHGLCDLSTKGVVTCKCHTYSNHQGAEFCLKPICAILIVYLYFALAPLLPEHHLVCTVIHVLLSLVIRNRCTSHSVYGCTSFSLWNSAILVTLSVLHNSRPAICVAETVYEMHVDVFLICNSFVYPTVLQHSRESRSRN